MATSNQSSSSSSQSNRDNKSKVKIIKQKQKGDQERVKLTGQVPRLTLVQISFPNSSCTEASIQHFLCEVTSDDLFICGVEPETWRQIQRLISFVHHNWFFHHQIMPYATTNKLSNLFSKKQIYVYTA